MCVRLPECRAATLECMQSKFQNFFFCSASSGTDVASWQTGHPAITPFAMLAARTGGPDTGCSPPRCSTGLPASGTQEREALEDENEMTCPICTEDLCDVGSDAGEDAAVVVTECVRPAAAHSRPCTQVNVM